MLQDKEGIPPDQQRLIFSSVELGAGFVTAYNVVVRCAPCSSASS